MAKLVLVSCLLLCLCVLSVSVAQDEDKKVYIVYMGAIPSDGGYELTSQHTNLLQQVTGQSSIEGRLVRSYKRSFNGFAAVLSESEKERLVGMEGVVSVFPNRKLQLHTTQSWDFMGLKDNKAKRVPSKESDIVVGVLDSGIWPESPSFNDKGFGPPPKKWKGTCAGGKNFTCNNKLIGARFYTSSGIGQDRGSARDIEGHGTHTASTAAGSNVKDTSFYGLGLGTARGGVPAARIAAYRVCDPVNNCPDDGILAAFDDAIADGVDVITISIGKDYGDDLEMDSIAIGSFHAMANGILTVNSAGNSGPSRSTTSSVAPWMLSVAASNTNRGLLTEVVLGNGKTVVGRSANPFDLKGEKYPLVYGESATKSCASFSAQYCSPGCLDNVKGKIVLCDGLDGIEEAEKSGAVGVIIKSTFPDVAFVYPMPVSAMSEDDYQKIASYVSSEKAPTAALLKTKEVMNQAAPVVVSFSSRGPNVIVDDILKPDITAPGVEILAAYSPLHTPSDMKSDKRRVNYNFVSGTSMSCPHVAGAAAYLKTFQPLWSPSMIQSAIMTTAWPMNASTNAEAEFAYGSGHLDPVAAVNPGLVYETTKADHIALLCGLNYTSSNLRLISGENITCTKEQSITLPRNLNYPSLTARVSVQDPVNVKFVRTVTNVGTPNSTYKAKIVKGAGSSKLSFKVEPEILSFKSVNEKKSFTVTVSGESIASREIVSVSLVWSDGVHSVKSPVVVYA